MKSHPLAVLRSLLERNHDTREFATQNGFAKILGKSPSLIREVESGRHEMSPKLARLISGMTGASIAWLMEKEVAGTSVPSEDGGEVSGVSFLGLLENWNPSTQVVKRVPRRAARPGEPPPRAQIEEGKYSSNRIRLRAQISVTIRSATRGLDDGELARLTDDLRDWLNNWREENERSRIKPAPDSLDHVEWYDAYQSEINKEARVLEGRSGTTETD